MISFAAILLTALAFVPGAAHLAEMPAKLGLSAADYLIVQQIYQGWSLFGIVQFGALAANGVLAWWSRDGAVARWAGAAVALIAVAMIIFFSVTYPVNLATANWTLLPGDWLALRARWEWSHAVNGVIFLGALACVVVAVIRAPRPAP